MLDEHAKYRRIRADSLQLRQVSRVLSAIAREQCAFCAEQRTMATSLRAKMIRERRERLYSAATGTPAASRKAIAGHPDDAAGSALRSSVRDDPVSSWPG